VHLGDFGIHGNRVDGLSVKLKRKRLIWRNIGDAGRPWFVFAEDLTLRISEHKRQFHTNWFTALVRYLAGDGVPTDVPYGVAVAAPMNLVEAYIVDRTRRGRGGRRWARARPSGRERGGADELKARMAIFIVISP
jgi:hypothetical protein